MSKRRFLIVPTALVAGLLTFAPIMAQETSDDVGGATPTTDTATEDDGLDPGWLGLLGLLGLAGLIRRDNHHRTDAARTNANR